MPSTAKVKLAFTCKMSPGTCWWLLSPPSRVLGLLCHPTASKLPHQQHLNKTTNTSYWPPTHLPLPISFFFFPRFTCLLRESTRERGRDTEEEKESQADSAWAWSLTWGSIHNTEIITWAETKSWTLKTYWDTWRHLYQLLYFLWDRENKWNLF